MTRKTSGANNGGGGGGSGGDDPIDDPNHHNNHIDASNPSSSGSSSDKPVEGRSSRKKRRKQHHHPHPHDSRDNDDDDDDEDDDGQQQQQQQQHHHQNQHNEEEEEEPVPPLAAAAVAAAPMDLSADRALANATLVGHFTDILNGTDQDKARMTKNALEATAGNLELAAHLYWDDYFASGAAMGGTTTSTTTEAKKDPPVHKPARKHEDDRMLPAAAAAGGDGDEDEDGPRHDSTSSSDEDDDDDDGDGNDDNNNNDNDNNDNDNGVALEDDSGNPGSHPHRKLRRSLDKDFGRAAARGKSKSPQRRRGRNSHSDQDQDEDDEEVGHPPEDEEMPPVPAHASNDVDDDDDDDDEDDDDDDDGIEDDEDDDDDDDDPVPRQVARELLPEAFGDEGGEGVSISDDEAGTAGVWRIVGNMVAQQLDQSDDLSSNGPQQPSRRRSSTSKFKAKSMSRKDRPRPVFNHQQRQQQIREAAAAVADKVLPPREDSPAPKPRRRRPEDEEMIDDAVDYISDEEWLMSESSGPGLGLPKTPLDFLWDTPEHAKEEPGHKSVADSNINNNNNNNNVSNNNNDNNNDNDAAGANNVDVNANVNAEAEAIGVAEESDQNEDESEDDDFAGIPHTWLNAFFSLSECGTGLELPPPTAEYVEVFTWRQHQNHGRNLSNGGIPPPFHCKAITSITSVVTAMLYTGASVQGGKITCKTAKKTFSKLTLEEKKLEFESRLVDALTALIHVAAKVSYERKARSLRKAKAALARAHQSANEGHDPAASRSAFFGERLVQDMKHSLRTIPACFWEEDYDTMTSTQRAPGGPTYRRIQAVSSFTNLEDIRLYVSSNIRSFTSRGGVALLLETIVRIHGPRLVGRLIRRAREAVPSHTRTTGHCALISCSCEARQQKMYKDKPLPQSVRNDPTKLLDTTPPGHDCVSAELLSLLLTGTVHATWKGWSTERLGFGFLGSNAASMGWQLARPAQPVWILQGEVCYSVMRLVDDDTTNVKRDTLARLDPPGAILRLEHWNTWYHQRQRTELRLMTAPAEWIPTLPAEALSSMDVWKAHRHPLQPRDTADLLKERQRVHQTQRQEAKKHEAMETSEPPHQVTPEELDRLEPNPDDKRFYPGKFQMWRFDLHEDHTDENAKAEPTIADDVSQRKSHWVPFHRLSKRQKLVVEVKLGPNIKRILWTRWPGATIDHFSPNEGEGYPVL